MNTSEFLNKMMATRKQNERGLQDVGLAEAAKRAGLQGVREIPVGALLRSYVAGVSRLTNPMDIIQPQEKDGIIRMVEDLEVELDRRLGAPRIAKEDRR